MKHSLRRSLSLVLLLTLVLSLLPALGVAPEVQAANLSTDIYQLPSKTLNDAGTKYRQNMSYIIRTRNGKIIVVDGGYSTNNSDANYLISQLKSITGKDVPNIDAWFFTHNHGDHVGAFKAIAARMPTAVTVSAVYYRFATDEEIDKYAPEADRASLKDSVKSFHNHVKLMKQANGQPTETVTLSARHVNRCNAIFNIDTVQIDVLMTCQEVFWGCDNITTKYSGNLNNNGKAYSGQTIKQLVEADFGNNTSAVFRMTTMGQSVLFLGDAAEPEGLMLKYYHDQNTSNKNLYFSLKSDIVQMAHHGQNAVPKSVYTAIAPKIALWPTPDWVYTPSSSSGLTTEYTKQWLKELGTTNYISKDGLKKVSINDIRSTEQPVIPDDLKPLVFDPVYYANRYADVKNAFGDDEVKLYSHFLKYGTEEGRQGSPYFDVKYYLSQNSARMSDTQKGDYEKGFNHFIKYAYEEAELTGGGAKKLSPEFDCKYYYNNYPILQELGLKNEFEILRYYITTGKAAGHKGAAEVKTLNGGVVYHTVANVSTVAPTCTAEGKTAGKKCSICGLVLQAQTAVAATGHSYTDVVTPPTCTEGGFTTHTCSVCSHSYVDVHTEATGHSYAYEDLDSTHRATCDNCTHTFTEAHSFTDGLCICGATELTLDETIVINHSLNLASDISVNFAVQTSLLEDYDSFLLEVKIPRYEGNEKVGTETLIIEPILNGYYYYFTLNGLTAVQMNDEVEATLQMTKNGRTYFSNTDRYSISTYAYSQLEKANAAEELKEMCANLLRYGAKAQLYKVYRTDSLADTAMTESQKTYLTQLDAVTFNNHNKILEDVENPMITWGGKTLRLDSKVVVRYVMDASAYGGDPEKLTLRVSYTDPEGTPVTVEVKNPEVYDEAEQWYAFNFAELRAAELRAVLSAAVYEGDVQVSPTLQYSVDTYCNNKTGVLGDLCKAMMAYSDSAAVIFAP